MAQNVLCAAGRKAMVVAAAAVAAAALVACAGTRISGPDRSGGVQVSLFKTVYRSNDTVAVRIKNISGAQLTYPYEFCRTALQQLNGNQWATVSEPTEGCPLALGLLGTGAEVTRSYVLPSSLRTGQYRLLLPSPEPKNAQTQEMLPTPVFTVNPVTL